MMDADVVMVQQVLQRVGARDKNMIFAFKRAQNMHLLPDPQPLKGRSSRPNLKLVREDMDLEEEHESFGISSCCQDASANVDAQFSNAFYLDQRYASGEIYTPHFLGALLARAFYTPGIVEAIQALIMLQEENMDGFLPWQVRLRSQDVGRT